MKFLDRKDLKVIAQAFALVHNKDHEYLPKDKDESISWQPHDWVVAAMEAAYVRGLEDSTKIHRKD